MIMAGAKNIWAMLRFRGRLALGLVLDLDLVLGLVLGLVLA